MCIESNKSKMEALSNFNNSLSTNPYIDKTKIPEPLSTSASASNHLFDIDDSGVSDGLASFNQSLIVVKSKTTPAIQDTSKSLNLVSTATSLFLNELSNRSETDASKRKSEIDWIDLILALCLCVLIVITVIGNTLVIISVLTTRRLRTVTNCFVMSLAVADWMVGIFVMPPAVALYLTGAYIPLLLNLKKFIELHYARHRNTIFN